MIIWFSNAPTPQFAGIIAALQADLDLDVVHLDAGDRGRGWGDFSESYDFSVAGPGWAAAFGLLWTKMLCNSPQALVSFGYVHPVAMLMLLGARLRGIPVYSMSDSSWYFERTRPRWRRNVKKVLLRCLLSRRTRIWTIGADNARYWSEYGFGNQVRTHFESPVPESTRLLVSAPSGSKVVLYVGRLAPEKGIGDAVEACQMLTDRGIDVQLWIVGRGDQPVPAEGKVIRLVGPVPHADLAAYLTMADVLVVPSRFEPYGLVVREALQFGLPVVGSEAVPALRELCDLGWNVVPAGDSRALAEAIRRATSNPRWPAMPPKDMSRFYRSELTRV